MLGFKTAPALELSGISHGFFSRQGGISAGVCDSLNAGFGANDTLENVRENRRRIAAALGTSEPSLLSCHQHHSTDVIIADGPWEAGYRPKADAVVTNKLGLACSALAADCAPVLFADPKARIIGAAHAGWRGALAGITDETVKAMEQLGAKRDDIIAMVGPCISQPNYEVGPEFIESFTNISALNVKYFKPAPQAAPQATPKTKPSDRQFFDLKAYVTDRLISFGVGHAASLPDCTYGQPETYFSYRYNCHHNVDGYGRNISAIMLR